MKTWSSYGAFSKTGESRESRYREKKRPVMEDFKTHGWMRFIFILRGMDSLKSKDGE